MSKQKEKFDWADVVVWGFILSVASALIGGITGITILTLIPVVFIAPFMLVAVVAFLGQAYFTGKDLKDDFRKSILRGPNQRR